MEVCDGWRQRERGKGEEREGERGRKSLTSVDFVDYVMRECQIVHNNEMVENWGLIGSLGASDYEDEMLCGHQNVSTRQ